MSASRLDALLVERGLVSTLPLAQALVLAGRVTSNGVVLDKAGTRMDPSTPLSITPPRRHVGRGALKLEGALVDLGVDPRDRECLDVGASTGGFTQVLLEAGARAVAAIDVGRALLDSRLTADPRVTVLDGINARYLEARMLPFRPSLAVVDVSFISLTKILPPVSACLAPEGELVALVKPQFEVRRGKVGRGGVVRDPALHREVLQRVISAADSFGIGARALSVSRITGAEGNTEFFVAFTPGAPGLSLERLAPHPEPEP